MGRAVYNTWMTDKQLVAGILSGDEPSLRYFYQTYSSKLVAFVRRRLGDEKDVEEIVQDTFLASLDALRDFTFKCSLSTFLCSIAKRKVVDFYRKKKLKKVLFSQFPQIESLLSLLTTPEEKLDEKLLVEKIENTFNKLSPRYKKILKLKYVDGFSVDEIAHELSMSFKGIESMLFRARKSFVLEYEKE
jgi:RNA polymerase sigma-70 factor (ECF subfamily)